MIVHHLCYATHLLLLHTQYTHNAVDQLLRIVTLMEDPLVDLHGNLPQIIRIVHSIIDIEEYFELLEGERIG
jgi:hypothetical protein